MIKKAFVFLSLGLASVMSHAATQIYIPSTSTYQGNSSVINIASGTIRNLNTNSLNVSTFASSGLFINVKGYPYFAKGDGSSNDTAAISSAVSDGVNKTIYFPPGTYMDTGNHTLTTQRLLGAGKNGTIIKRLSGTNPLFILTSSGAVAQMTLDGNSLAAACMKVNGCQFGEIQSVKFVNVISTYALLLVPTAPSTLTGNQFLNLKNLEFRNNAFGNIFIQETYYSSFYDTSMIGYNTDAGIKFSTSATDLNFYNTYMESPIDMRTTGIRDIHFTGMRVRLDTMSKAWWTSNYPTGSEVAQVTLEHASIFKAVNISSYPVFDVTTYQLFMKDIHVYDSASSSGWYVLKDNGTNNFRMQDWTIESANSWLLFDPSSSGGHNTIADSVNYTQGVTGLATWPNDKPVGSTSSFVTVNNSNLNHNIRASVGAGLASGYLFNHIYGNLDLSNALGPVSVFDLQVGTITDPNHVMIGSNVSSFTANAVNLTTSGTFQDVIYSTFTTGDWLLNGIGFFDIGTSTWSRISIGISSTPITPGVLVAGDNRAEQDFASSKTTPTNETLTIPSYKVTVTANASPQVFYLKAFSTFNTAVSSPNITGRISGVRIPSISQ